MTVDERIEKLTERHEALAQTVELIAHAQEKASENIDKILLAISKDAENIRSLANIAAAHQSRIENLEQRPR